MKSLLLLSPLLTISLWGQDPPSVPAAWDVTRSVGELAAQVAQLKPLLDQFNPRSWVENGAPEAYVAQWQSAQDELGYLAQAAQALEKQPERLTAALDL